MVNIYNFIYRFRIYWPYIWNIIKSLIIVFLTFAIIFSGLYFYASTSIHSISNPRGIKYRAIMIIHLKRKSRKIKNPNIRYRYCILVKKLYKNKVSHKACIKLIKENISIKNIMRKDLSNMYINMALQYIIIYVPAIFFVLLLEFNIKMSILRIINLMLKQSISAIAIYSITINLSSIMSEFLKFGDYLSIFIPIIAYIVFMLQFVISELLFSKHDFSYGYWIPPILKN